MKILEKLKKEFTITHDYRVKCFNCEYTWGLETCARLGRKQYKSPYNDLVYTSGKIATKDINKHGKCKYHKTKFMI